MEEFFSMSFKDTVKQMRELLVNISTDLEKAEGGNKAASQRVRTGTVRLEKIAKLYRKESIASEKKNKGQKKPAKSAAKSSAKGGSASTKSGGKSSGSSSKSKAVKAKPKAKSAKASTSVRPRQMSLKRATAKLPTKRFA
jgi:hypothetical protein